MHRISRAVRVLSMLILLVAAGACDSQETDDVILEFDLTESSSAWTALFADYPPGEEEFYELESGFRRLPASIDTTKRALFISGNNHSDDLFMGFYRRADGLKSGVRYDVSFTVEIATSVPSGCVGVGGAPGESVHVKAGVSAVRPQREQPGDGFYRLNVDKGNQAASGANAVVIGNVANSRACESPEMFELKRMTSEPGAVTVRVDEEGGVWLFMGTDSGFEATTSIYFTYFRAEFNRS